MFNNQYRYLFRTVGIVLGCLILFFSLALLSIEIGRIYSGSINHGRNDSSDAYEYLIFPGLVIDYNGASYNPKIENRWMWPWSTATLLFSFVFIITGVLGITSGLKESYTIILTFFICSLSSICLLIFLIATYSTIIAGWKSIYGTYNGNLMPRFPRIDRDLSIVCLVISCLLFIIVLISFILSGRHINVCTRKQFPPSRNEYERIQAPNTLGAVLIRL